MSSLLILLSILVVVTILLRILAGKQYSMIIKTNKIQLVHAILAPVSLYLIDTLKIMDLLPVSTEKIHQRIVVIYGAKASSLGTTKICIAQAISLMIIMLYLFIVAALIDGGNIIYAALAPIISSLSPLIVLRGLDKQIKKKKQSIIIELPEFINKLTLLINAGETVQQAIIRCVENKKAKKNHPLYAELMIVASDISIGYSFPVALDNLNKRCGMQEVAFFSTTVLLNYRRGGDDFVVSLRNLSSELWLKRKALAKTLGEEASAKLVFPMMIIFLVLMLIISTPAVLLMNG